MALPKCTKCGKYIHSSKRKAAIFKRNLKKYCGYRGKVYRCEFCFGWHVGCPVGNFGGEKVL